MYILINDETANVEYIKKQCQEELKKDGIVLASANGLLIEDSAATRGLCTVWIPLAGYLKWLASYIFTPLYLRLCIVILSMLWGGDRGVNISRLPYPFFCLPRLFANCLPRPAHFQPTSLRRYIKLACLILPMTGAEFQWNRRNFEPFLNPNDFVCNYLFLRTLDRFRLSTETSTSKWQTNGVLCPFWTCDTIHSSFSRRLWRSRPKSESV